MPLLLAAGEEEIVIVALPILSGLVVLMTMIITYHARRSQRDDMEATLKMEMIQQGRSAEEIERVLAARFGDHRTHRRPPAQGLARGPARGNT
ncbi:MAG: hypothetical protein DWQ37_03710 [Planctomycetota bacterium]|nr:MAG: hypothetical protein DWQ37_03710 [Planctomycetota bacterium]